MYQDWDFESIETTKIKQYTQREFLERLWNKAGEQIIAHYNKTRSKNIQFRKREALDNENIRGSCSYQVCFVIDATGSMYQDIQKAKDCVKNLSDNKKYNIQIKIIVYRDHDVFDDVIDQFPATPNFTTDIQGAI